MIQAYIHIIAYMHYKRNCTGVYVYLFVCVCAPNEEEEEQEEEEEDEGWNNHILIIYP